MQLHIKWLKTCQWQYIIFYVISGLSSCDFGGSGKKILYTWPKLFQANTICFHSIRSRSVLSAQVAKKKRSIELLNGWNEKWHLHDSSEFYFYNDYLYSISWTKKKNPYVPHENFSHFKHVLSSYTLMVQFNFFNSMLMLKIGSMVLLLVWLELRTNDGELVSGVFESLSL